jgi:hypothetical protein
LSAPPTPPAEENKKGKENFWFLLPRPKGADEARRLVLARIVLVKSSDFVQETQPKQNNARFLPGFIFVIVFERVGFESGEGVGKREFPVVEVLEPSGSKE